MLNEMEILTSKNVESKIKSCDQIASIVVGY